MYRDAMSLYSERTIISLVENTYTYELMLIPDGVSELITSQKPANYLMRSDSIKLRPSWRQTRRLSVITL